MKGMQSLIDLEIMHAETMMQETIVAPCHGALWESKGLGCSNYHVPSATHVKRLSVHLETVLNLMRFGEGESD